MYICLLLKHTELSLCVLAETAGTLCGVVNINIENVYFRGDFRIIKAVIDDNRKKGKQNLLSHSIKVSFINFYFNLGHLKKKLKLFFLKSVLSTFLKFNLQLKLVCNVGNLFKTN